MSGHSKWSTIKHKKAATDHKKGNVFTKAANAISVAVKIGGGIGDPDFNFSLRLAIEKAKAVNMPGENIKRAIEHGLGRGKDQELAELLIEGFGPGGFVFMVEVVTNNRNRSVAEIRTIIEKNGGRMGEPGSVPHHFNHLGVVTYTGTMTSEIELRLIDSGVVEFVKIDDENMVYTEDNRVSEVAKQMANEGLVVSEISLAYIPILEVAATESITAFLDLIRESDDVQEVYTNAV